MPSNLPRAHRCTEFRFGMPTRLRSVEGLASQLRRCYPWGEGESDPRKCRRGILDLGESRCRRANQCLADAFGQL